MLSLAAGSNSCCYSLTVPTIVLTTTPLQNQYPSSLCFVGVTPVESLVFFLLTIMRSVRPSLLQIVVCLKLLQMTGHPVFSSCPIYEVSWETG